MCTELDYSYMEAVQAVNFFALSSPHRKINKIKALKLIYLADRDHLRRHGRTITNDEYFAMEYGPVPSATKDILQLDEISGSKEKKYASKFLTLQQRYMIKSVGDLDSSLFSDSELNSLRLVFDKFSRFGPFVLARDITHQLPEWRKNKSALSIARSEEHTSELQSH